MLTKPRSPDRLTTFPQVLLDSFDLGHLVSGGNSKRITCATHIRPQWTFVYYCQLQGFAVEGVDTCKPSQGVREAKLSK